MSSIGPGFGCLLRSWHLHESELKAYLRRRVPTDALADDLMQDVFVKAMRQGEGLCRVDNLRVWLFQVARHALVDDLRRPRVNEPLCEVLEETIAEETPQAQAPTDSLSGPRRSTWLTCCS